MVPRSIIAGPGLGSHPGPDVRVELHGIRRTAARRAAPAGVGAGLPGPAHPGPGPGMAVDLRSLRDVPFEVLSVIGERQDAGVRFGAERPEIDLRDVDVGR